MSLERVMRARIDAIDCQRERLDDICVQRSAARIPNVETVLERLERYAPSSFGSAKITMSAGRISGMPPTRVLTTSRPDEAASMRAVPNASVNEVLRKICPRCRT